MTVTLERGNTTVVIRHVPAEICFNCGEEYIDEKTTEEIFEIAERDVCAGVQVDIREFQTVCTET
jgi:YgiT-type zinc finger domain-containing protein